MVEDNAFLATGTTAFNGARIGIGAVVAINAVVRIRANLPAGARVPIGWVAAGDPTEVLPPDEDEQRCEII